MGQLLGAVFIAAALGALIGTALTPRSPTADEVSPLDDDEIERRAESIGDLPDSTVVRPVDFDGDGLPDLDANGDPILGYDEDGDGIIDGYLQPCPERTATVAFETALTSQPATAPLDVDCDGEIEKYLEFDDTPFTRPVEALPPPNEPPATIAPEQIEERARDQSSDSQFGSVLRNVLIGLAVLAVIVALAVAVMRWRRNDDDDAGETAPPPPTPPGVERPIARTIDAMVRDIDPRQAIIEAYGTLLAELAAIGLPRRPEEAPAEHISRCLQRADLDEASVTELIELFSLARFSTHPVTEQHRVAAIRCLRRSVHSDLVSTGSWPPPPGAGA